MLRGQIEPERVYVIPNALVADNFAPVPAASMGDMSESGNLDATRDETPPQLNPVTIVVMPTVEMGVGVEGEAGKKGRSAVMVGNHQR